MTNFIVTLKDIVMPKILVEIPESNESVTRPIVFDIIKQVCIATGTPQNTVINYPGDLAKTKQPGTSIGSDSDTLTLPFTNRINIDVEENYEQDRLLSTAVFRPENLYIFRDDSLETNIKPAYSSTEITINFKYRAVDKVTAVRWRDDIRAKVSMNRDVFLHDISYHYLIPTEFIIILEEIHRLRENVAGYGDTFDEYFFKNRTNRVSFLTTLAGTQGSWGVSEKQMRILGWFDFEGVPELGSKEDDADTWTISFSYKFRYDKPIACVMFYPIMIHNQLIDAKYRHTEIPYDPDQNIASYAMSTDNFRAFEKGHTRYNVNQGIQIPITDEFVPAGIVESTIRVFTALTSVEKTDLRSLMSLRDLGVIEFEPDVLSFLISEAPYMTKAYLSIFTLSLYRGIDLLGDGIITVDSNLNVKATSDLSLRHYYHIRLGLVTDLNLLSQAAKDRLREHGKALRIILDAIDPTLKAKGLLPTIIGGGNGTIPTTNPGYVGKRDLDKAIDEMNRAIMSQGEHYNRQRNTVMIMFVQAINEKYSPADIQKYQKLNFGTR